MNPSAVCWKKMHVFPSVSCSVNFFTLIFGRKFLTCECLVATAKCYVFCKRFNRWKKLFIFDVTAPRTTCFFISTTLDGRRLLLGDLYMNKIFVSGIYMSCFCPAGRFCCCQARWKSNTWFDNKVARCTSETNTSVIHIAKQSNCEFQIPPVFFPLH